jgi:hypothetical protein
VENCCATEGVDATSFRADRHKKKSGLKQGDKMTLEVIGAGFGRTGTWSTFAALNRLGFPSYHMQEVILNKANKGHLDFWRKVANSPPGTQHDWNR